MRILVISYKFGTEKEIGQHLGTYHYFIEIMRKLVQRGHQVYVIAPWLKFTHKGCQEIDGIKILRYYPPLWAEAKAFPLNRFLRWWYIKVTEKQVLSFDQEQKPEVIFVWQARETGYAVAEIKDKLQAPFIFRQITTWRWHFERNVSQIFSQRSWYQFFKLLKLSNLIDWWLEFLLDRKRQMDYAHYIYEKADKVLFVSEIAANEGREMGLSESEIGILPVSIETDLFKPLNRKIELRKELELKGSKIILFIGRINFAEKGISYLLEAMSRIISEVPDVNLVIIGGGGESERMFNLIKELKIENNVQLVSKKPFTDLVKYINASDVFVVPSVWLETFGQVTIEAMACGVPVVTSDAGASPEINLDEKTGLVVPAKNSEKLSQAVIRILNNEELKNRFGKAARERVLNNYTYEVVVNKLLDIFQEVKTK